MITRALYGPEPGWILHWLNEQREAYMRQTRDGCCCCCGALWFLVVFELKLALLSILVGPFFAWRAALTLALSVRLLLVKFW